METLPQYLNEKKVFEITGRALPTFGGFFMEKLSPFRSMAERWPSSMVARTEIERFTGGIMSEKYMSNLDSQGRGPAGRVRVGRKVAYPVTELVAWLESRSAVIPDRHQAAK